MRFLFYRPPGWVLAIAFGLGPGLVAQRGKAEQVSRSLRLVEEGRSRAVIVQPDPRGRDRHNRWMEDNAVEILRTHLQQMSGAALPVVSESDLGDAEIADGKIVPSATSPASVREAEVFILVGQGELAERLDLPIGDLVSGGILVQTTGNVLALMGPYDGSPYRGGTLYATTRFLEELGFAYLWPGELGKVVPDRPTVDVGPIRHLDNPPIAQRGIRFDPRPRHHEAGVEYLGWTEDDYLRFRQQAAGTTAAEGSRAGWAGWHGLGGDIGLSSSGHDGAGLGLDGWEIYGRDHPEWFALQADGTRDQTGSGDRFRLCKSSEALIEHVARDIIARRDGNPELRSVSLSPNDGGYSSWCLCEDCKALDPPEAPKVNVPVFEKVGESSRKTIQSSSLSDRVLHYWNGIARHVEREHPDLLFVVDAYSVFSHAPVRGVLHPNLVVRYVPASTEGWIAWQQAGARKIYWRPNHLYQGVFNGTLGQFDDRWGHRSFARDTAEIMSVFAKNQMVATDIQGIYDHWATMGLNYYVSARMAWDPTRTFEQLLAEYSRAGFGPAAAPIERYWTEVQDLGASANSLVDDYTPEAVAGLHAQLDEAQELAADHRTIRERVAFLRAGLVFTDLSARGHRLRAAAVAGEPVDMDAAHELLDRRWLLMREIFRRHHLAVNVAAVAALDSQLWRPLRWQGPGDQARLAARARDASGDFEDEAWLYGDQTDWID